ncbi:MAG: transglutaminase-like domain-containing protein [Dehalococcoidia bacterium]|nr:transglutaminase-like domain-containing protein [Dehalococcoidia bacterium]
MTERVPINDQPIAATFFGEGRWLTSFITPAAMEVQELHRRLTEGVSDSRERITACWDWVTSNIRYVEFVKGKLWINGKASVQNDLWVMPELTIQTRVGNCAVSSFLLCSLLRNELPPEQVHCTLGNLYNGTPGGHAWLTLNLDGEEFTMESTTPKIPPLVPSRKTTRYEAVHYFNDVSVAAVEGKTQLIPFKRVYSDWLSDYLNWAYIQSGDE